MKILEKNFGIIFAEAFSGTIRKNSAHKKTFVCINITNAGNNGLVEDGGFDRLVLVTLEVLVELVWRHIPGLFGEFLKEFIFGKAEFVDNFNEAKFALIVEIKVGAIVELKVNASVTTGHVGVEVVVGMTGGELIVTLEDELAGHTKVDHHVNIVAEFDEEHFAATTDILDSVSFDVCSVADEIFIRKNVDFFDGFSKRAFGETATDSFYFRKFWHKSII